MTKTDLICEYPECNGRDFKTIQGFRGHMRIIHGEGPRQTGKVLANQRPPPQQPTQQQDQPPPQYPPQQSYNPPSQTQNQAPPQPQYQSFQRGYKCRSCFSAIPDNTSKCPNCGEDIFSCRRCHAQTNEYEDKCYKCGEAIPFCPFCRSQIRGNDGKCIKCGKKIEYKRGYNCRICFTKIPDDEVYCPSCGEIKYFCPDCFAQMGEDEVHCYKCGWDDSGEEDSEPTFEEKFISYIDRYRCPICNFYMGDDFKGNRCPACSCLLE